MRDACAECGEHPDPDREIEAHWEGHTVHFCSCRHAGLWFLKRSYIGGSRNTRFMQVAALVAKDDE